MNSDDNSTNDTSNTRNTRIKSPGRRAMRDALKASRVVIVPGHRYCVDAGGAYMVPDLRARTGAGAPHPDGNRAHRRAMLAKGRTAQRRASRGRERLKAAVDARTRWAW